MHIIIIPNYKKKAAILALILLFQVAMLAAGDFLIKNSLLMNVTIDRSLEFSYPLSIVVDDIAVRKQADETSVRSQIPFSVPAVRQFNKYESLEGKFSFDYPTVFEIQPQQFTGADILYHIAFHGKNGPDQGFIQVWNLPGTLKDFLDKAKESSSQVYGYFRTGSVKVNGVPGYYWDYTVLSGGKYYKGNEVFLKKDGRMYRISYFLPESEWNGQKSELFKNMVKSFKILN